MIGDFDTGHVAYKSRRTYLWNMHTLLGTHVSYWTTQAFCLTFSWLIRPARTHGKIMIARTGTIRTSWARVHGAPFVRGTEATGRTRIIVLKHLPAGCEVDTVVRNFYEDRVRSFVRRRCRCVKMHHVRSSTSTPSVHAMLGLPSRSRWRKAEHELGRNEVTHRDILANSTSKRRRVDESGASDEQRCHSSISPRRRRDGVYFGIILVQIANAAVRKVLRIIADF